MDGLTYRLNEWIRPTDHRGLLVDSSAGLALGALPGLEDYAHGARAVLAVIDGLVCSPGQIRRLSERTRRDAALLVRMDWTNTLRGPDFVLPPAAPHRLPILTPQDALALGAAGMVASFFLGYDEEIEADCLKTTVQWALAGKALGLPLVIEVCPTGPRVMLPDKAVELGASYALEGGADVIVVPHPGRKSLETLAAFLSVPWLVKAGSTETALVELEEALACGASGIWLDHRVFSAVDPAASLQSLSERLHAPVAA
jgi:DhnA family fructose-bisphosphate aldolase class Ia